MWRSGAVFTFFAAIALLAASCAPHTIPPPAEAPAAHSWYWIDLRAGWRVRVVTPVTKSRGYLIIATPAAAKSEKALHVSPQAPRAATVDLKTGKNFVGYEVALYSVKSQRGGGVRIVFRSAVINSSGKKTTPSRALFPMFKLPRDDKFVRILHLGSGSHGDHDAAILAASNPNLLDSLAREVALDHTACRIGSDPFCSWVPAGIAVIPEHRKSAVGKSQWTAAY
ncbi:MAG TPA: hypothetical protein VFZ27_11595 [Terriglobia bacterium]|nr:hypothetical protein [Terriglobia bacterium]